METNDYIKDRIALLFTALQYCSQIKQTFTIGERIMINQERFQWLHILTYPMAVPRIVSEAIENKLKNVHKAIADYDHQLLSANPFKNEPE